MLTPLGDKLRCKASPVTMLRMFFSPSTDTACWTVCTFFRNAKKGEFAVFIIDAARPTSPLMRRVILKKSTRRVTLAVVDLLAMLLCGYAQIASDTSRVAPEGVGIAGETSPKRANVIAARAKNENLACAQQKIFKMLSHDDWILAEAWEFSN